MIRDKRRVNYTSYIILVLWLILLESRHELSLGLQDNNGNVVKLRESMQTLDLSSVSSDEESVRVWGSMTPRLLQQLNPRHIELVN